MSKQLILLNFKYISYLSKRLRKNGFTKDSMFPRINYISSYLLDLVIYKNKLIITSEDLLNNKIIDTNSTWLTQEFVTMLEKTHFILILSDKRISTKIEFKIGPNLKDIIKKELRYMEEVANFETSEPYIFAETIFDYTKTLIEQFNPPYDEEKHKLWYETGIKNCKLERIKQCLKEKNN